MSVYHSFVDYTEALSNFINTPYKIVNGIGYAYTKGVWIPDEEYRKFVNRPTYEPPPKDNKDGTCISPEIIKKKRK